MKRAALLAGLVLFGCQPRSQKSAAPAASYRAPSFVQGRFTVAKQGDRFWLIAPDGSRFLSQGVNHVGDASFRAPNQNYYDPVKHQFAGNEAAWAKSALGRLSSWGFNTVGAWSNEALYGKRHPYTFMLYAAGFDRPLEHVFDADFPVRAAQNTEKARAYKDDPYLIGYFLDNELPFWGEFGWRAAQQSLLQKYAQQPAGSAGKRELRAFLEQRHGRSLSAFNRAYHTSLSSFDALDGPLELQPASRAARHDADEFAGVVAERYFAVTTAALRERDASHLQLCVRFAGEVPWPVVTAAAKYCDVISINQYRQSGDVDVRLLDDLYVKSQKPLLLTEYSFSAMQNQSGNPNTRGAMVTVPTQRARAEHTTRFATQALSLRYLVGMHWFEWADQSPQGRFDGEDQNYGLVDIHDTPYELLTEAHLRLNASAQAIHESGRAQLPTEFVGDPQARLPASARVLGEPLTYFEASRAAGTPTWGDTANAGKLQVEPSPDGARLRYESGSGWGAGVSLLPVSSPFDASGAAHLELTLQIPAGQRVQVLINEAGAAAAGQASYRGHAGSDGESYEFPVLVGSGKQETYVIDLLELERRTAWGNQRGARVLDLQALVTVDLYVPGKQGNGEIRVVALRFTR